MRVRAVYNFYFEYQLPRLDPDTGLSLTIDVPNKGYIATVRGRQPEDDLFHESIRTSLSEQAPVLAPHGGQTALVYRVKERVLDRLFVALDLTAEAAEQSAPKVNTYWRDEAVFVANGVLDHLRVTARSPRVKGLERLWHPVAQTVTISHPYTESWFDLDSGAHLPLFPSGAEPRHRVGIPADATVSGRGLLACVPGNDEVPSPPGSHPV